MTDQLPSVVAPRCLKLAEWPPHERVAFEAAGQTREAFDDPVYGSELAKVSVEKARRGYGRWLFFLACMRWLDPSEPPLARATRRRLIAYFKALKDAGNSDYTIIGRFSELAMALKMIVPGADVSRVRRPWGVTMFAYLPKAKRQFIIPDSGVLGRWAIRMMNKADIVTGGDAGLLAFRDGLLLAILAFRARRLRSMAGPRVGEELVLQNGRYWIKLGPELVKTKRPDHFHLPDELTPYVRRYLDVVRPALLAGNVSNDLWISTRGTKWSTKGIQNRVFELTEKRFGVAFGTHRFRYAIATTAVLRDPEFIGLGALSLGNSRAITEEHYERAGQIVALDALDALVERRHREFALK